MQSLLYCAPDDMSKICVNLRKAKAAAKPGQAFITSVRRRDLMELIDLDDDLEEMSPMAERFVADRKDFDTKNGGYNICGFIRRSLRRKRRLI